MFNSKKYFKNTIILFLSFFTGFISLHSMEEKTPPKAVKIEIEQNLQSLFLPRNPNLIPVTLTLENVTDYELYITLKKITRPIIHLNILSNKITDTGFIKIVPFCKDLQILNLAGCENITEKGFYDFFQLLHEQQSRNSIKNKGHLLCLGFNKIKEINLAYCKNVTDSIISLLSQTCPQLEKLDLSQCTKISNIGLYLLSKNGHNLKDINFSGCKEINDSGLVHLSKNCFFLEKLNLNFCEKITDKGLSYIYQVCHLLDCLKLVGCNNITDVDKEIDKQRLKGINLNIKIFK